MGEDKAHPTFAQDVQLQIFPILENACFDVGYATSNSEAMLERQASVRLMVASVATSNSEAMLERLGEDKTTGPQETGTPEMMGGGLLHALPSLVVSGHPHRSSTAKGKIAWSGAANSRRRAAIASTGPALRPRSGARG